MAASSVTFILLNPIAALGGLLLAVSIAGWLGSWLDSRLLPLAGLVMG